MEQEKNISGISENLADSIAEQKVFERNTVNKGMLHGKLISISVSDSEEIEQLGMSAHHIKDISIEIARYLLVNGAKMLYGGDLRNGGYTELFAELSYQYKYINDSERNFINYFPFPNSVSVTTDVQAKFYKKRVEPKIIETPNFLGKIDITRRYEPFSNVEDRYIFAECFTDMRIQMAKDSDARIVLGGKQKGYVGFFPGIVEETFHSLNEGKAVYLLGGFGGAAKSIIDTIMGGSPIQLTNDFQFDSEFLKNFKTYASGKSSVIVDYDFINEFFKKQTIKSISGANGLSIDENEILFESTNIHEIVFLIVKGLKNLSN